jgi:hypothetical protein
LYAIVRFHLFGSKPKGSFVTGSTANSSENTTSICSKQFGNCRSVGDSRPYRREYSPNSPNKKTNVEQRFHLFGSKPKGSFVTGSTANSSENTTSISSFPKFGNCRSVGDSRPYRREYSPNSPNKKTNVEQSTTSLRIDPNLLC